MENEPKPQPERFTDEEKTSFSRYGAILLGIHARLVIEGYFLSDGKTWNIFKIGTIIGSFEEEYGD